MEEKVTQPVIDFTTYVDESTHNFTGREWVFKKIDAWLADPQAGRFFLLTGKPGSGKTAIAGRLSRFAYPPETTLPPRGENFNREAGQADDPVFRETVLKMDDETTLIFVPAFSVPSTSAWREIGVGSIRAP